MCEVNMQDIILLKQGEIVLKGLNKKYFEQKLISNVKRRLRSLGEFDVTCTQSTIYVEPKSDDIDMDETQQAMTKVFGIAAVVRAAACDKTPEAMAQKAIEYMAEAMREAGRFKVETRRADKAFPMTSIEVSQYVGGELAEAIGITQANLSILKTNKGKAIRFSTLDAICKKLNCTPGDILEYVEDNNGAE